MPVSQFCRRNVWTIGPDETVREAAHRMKNENVGCLVVVDGGKPVGILTDRDIALEVLTRKLDPDALHVREIMHAPPITIDDKAPLRSAIQRMRSEAIRRLPVVDGSGALLGLVTADDVALLIAQELNHMTGPIAAQHVKEPPNPVKGSVERSEWWR